jgi:hypothetical protein
MALELSRALQFFFTSTQFNQINHIVLAGGCAVIPGADEVVASRTQINTIIANPVCRHAAFRSGSRQESADRCFVIDGRLRSRAAEIRRMIRINLLPHREEKRRARRQQFYALLGLVTLLSGLIVFLVYSVIAGYISAQDARNDFLKKEIAVLDKEIDQIKRLKEQSDALMERKRIIESLQRDRAEAVRLLSELAKQMPEGVYLRSLKQEGQRISLFGSPSRAPGCRR